MLFGKKTALTLSSLVLLSIVSACSSNVVPSSVSLKGDSNFQDSNLVNRISETVTQSKQDPSHFYIDAGKGQKTGASLTVKLNLGKGGFKTKAAITDNGTGASITSDIASLNVALIDSSAAPAGTLGTPVSQGTLVRNTTGSITGYTTGIPGEPGTLGADGATTVTFTNLPASTNEYWVAAAAFSNVIPSLLTNITNPAATITDATLGEYYVSTGSKYVKTGIDASGRAAYLVEGAGTDLAINLKLLDATEGAKIGTDVNIEDGTTAISGTIVIN